MRDADVDGRTVLLRGDLNVPLEDGERRRRHPDPRRAADDRAAPRARRIDRPLLAPRAARRTATRRSRWQPVAARLAELLGTDVALAPAVFGDEVEAAVEGLERGDVLLLENTRYEPGETKNDPELASGLAKLADVYVNDAFGAAHRAHATTEGVARHLPGLRGAAARARGARADRRPRRSGQARSVVVLGGAKVTDKIARDRPLPRHRRRDPDRRRHVLQLLPRPGPSRPVTRWSRRRASSWPRIALEMAESSECELRLPTDLVLGERFSAEAEAKSSTASRSPTG